MAAKAKLTLDMTDGTRPEIDGYLVAPGLGVHRALLPPGESGERTQAIDMWNIVHIESGRRVCGSFPTRKAALECAKEIAPLADWTKADGSGTFRSIAAKILVSRNRILMEADGLITTSVAATTQPLEDVTAEPITTLF